MAINKGLNIGVKKAFKSSDWVGFDAVEVIPKSLRDSVNTSDYGKIAQAKIDKINELLRTDGYKINESIDDSTLQDQISFVTNYRNDEGKKLENTIKKTKLTSNDIQHAHEQEIMADSLNFVLEAMKKEQKLRDAINTKIEVAKREDSLDSWNALKDSWRTLDQKQTIQENIKRVEQLVKASQEAAKVEAAKQAKLDKLNQQLASTTDPNEKKVIASQISDLMGTVSTQTGLPKGIMYFGIGIAVVVGILITIRAIRK